MWSKPPSDAAIDSSCDRVVHVMGTSLPQKLSAGYYEAGKQVSNQQAQIDMIENALNWAGVENVTNVSNPSSPERRLAE